MKAFPCLVAIVLAVAVKFPGCDGFPSDYPEGGAYHDLGTDNQNWENKDVDVHVAPAVAVSHPGDHHDGHGNVGDWDAKNDLDKVLENVRYTVAVPGHYGKGGVVSGLTLGKVTARSIVVQGVN